MHLATLDAPATHPRAAEGPIEVFGYVVHHPDAPIVFDTGVGTGIPQLDELFRPRRTDIVEALHRCGVDERDVAAVVNCHLHFDHCGQNSRFESVPVYVQRAELEAARVPGFTVPEWAAIPEAGSRILDGDAVIAPGVLIAATPGHTPGHQSLVISTGEETAIVAGQCGYCAAEFGAGLFPDSELHDPSWKHTAQRSLDRLRALAPVAAYFSHDDKTFEPAPSA